jgi:hypothetical protein
MIAARAVNFKVWAFISDGCNGQLCSTPASVAGLACQVAGNAHRKLHTDTDNPIFIQQDRLRA